MIFCISAGVSSVDDASITVYRHKRIMNQINVSALHFLYYCSDETGELASRYMNAAILLSIIYCTISLLLRVICVLCRIACPVSCVSCWRQNKTICLQPPRLRSDISRYNTYPTSSTWRAGRPRPPCSAHFPFPLPTFCLLFLTRCSLPVAACGVA